MFSQASVILFTGGRAWQGRMRGRGACMAGGMHGGVGHTWGGGMRGLDPFQKYICENGLTNSKATVILGVRNIITPSSL